jgi:hypothetical protein
VIGIFAQRRLRVAHALRRPRNPRAGSTPMVLEGAGTGVALPFRDEGTDQFGVIYIHGNLTVQGLHTFKGHIFVDGNVTIATGARLIVLGAVMAHGTYTHVGTGQTDLIYSREASLRGLLHARPWRVLSWADTAMQQ